MLVLPEKSLKKDACEMFKLVQIYMGDRKAKVRMTLNSVALELCNMAYSKPPLRDELYIQICRQTTEHPVKWVSHLTEFYKLVFIVLWRNQMKCQMMLKHQGGVTLQACVYWPFRRLLFETTWRILSWAWKNTLTQVTLFLPFISLIWSPPISNLLICFCWQRWEL